MLQTLFNELQLTGPAHRIYSYLLECNGASARQIAENLNIPRPSVYDNLKSLSNHGLVIEQIKNDKKVFCVDDVKKIPQILEDKIHTLEIEKKKLEKLIPTLLTQGESFMPKIKFYTGKEGVRQVLNDVLWYKDIEIQSMFPISEMIAVLGKEYFENHNRQRIRKNIYIKAIWPKARAVSFKDQPALGAGKAFKREIRIAPKQMIWDMGYWNYADKVAIVSSRKEGFGFIISSKDFSQLLKAQFDLIWSISKELKTNPKDTEEFLKSV
ncbi:MAG: hypothetical protein RIQ72_32 [Candidatus Parcubacteria bacterium]|jgi:sugar-specific transcriptional regulator TrmB